MNRNIAAGSGTNRDGAGLAEAGIGRAAQVDEPAAS